MNQTPTDFQWVRLPANALRALPQNLARTLAPADAVGLLRQLGTASADQFLAELDQRGGPNGDAAEQPVEQLWEQLSNLFSEMGWGTLRHQHLHAAIGALQSDNWTEGSADVEPILPGCHLSTGVFAELLSRLAGRDVAVMEVECRSRGSDRCTFLFGSGSALGQVYEELRKGMPYEQAIQQLD